MQLGLKSVKVPLIAFLVEHGHRQDYPKEHAERLFSDLRSQVFRELLFLDAQIVSYVFCDVVLVTTLPVQHKLLTVLDRYSGVVATSKTHPKLNSFGISCVPELLEKVNDIAYVVFGAFVKGINESYQGHNPAQLLHHSAEEIFHQFNRPAMLFVLQKACSRYGVLRCRDFTGHLM